MPPSQRGDSSQQQEGSSVTIADAPCDKKMRDLRPRSWSHELQRTRNVVLHLLAFDHRIEEALFEQELTPLKSFGQFLADRLLNHARAGEADECAGFGDVEVAEHRE